MSTRDAAAELGRLQNFGRRQFLVCEGRFLAPLVAVGEPFRKAP
jgi:hypothetical protein